MSQHLDNIFLQKIHTARRIVFVIIFSLLFYGSFETNPGEYISNILVSAFMALFGMGMIMAPFDIYMRLKAKYDDNRFL